jgi:hypothetical protein
VETVGTGDPINGGRACARPGTACAARTDGTSHMAGMINVVRTWGDELSLGLQRARESRTAMQQLVADARAADDVTRAVRSGSTWDDPFDAVRELAQQGNRGLWDGWTKADAAHSLLGRAISKHPGGAGHVELVRAREIAEQASGDLGNWISTSGRGAALEALEASVRGQLDEIRALGEQVAAAAR